MRAESQAGVMTMADRRMYRDARTSRARIRALRARYTYHRLSVLTGYAEPRLDEYQQAFRELLEERMCIRIRAAKLVATP